MPSRTEYDQTLDQLATLLRQKPMTARQIADELKCCRPAAYQRLRALKKRGDPLRKVRTPKQQGRPGPRAVRYEISEA